MAVPKRKTSKARKRKRRANDALPSVQLAVCPRCNHRHIPHTVCSNCGYYRGKQVIKFEE